MQCSWRRSAERSPEQRRLVVVGVGSDVADAFDLHEYELPSTLYNTFRQPVVDTDSTPTTCVGLVGICSRRF